MKCILYISKVIAQDGAMIPKGFSEIFRIARKNNAEIGVTGALSYSNGYYIQVLEGSEEVVDELFAKVSNDPRHEQITVIINQTIVKRSFSDWSMKLPQSVNKDPDFAKFFKASAYAISSLKQNKKELLQQFYNVSGTARGLRQTFQGKGVKLTAWPDFNVIKPSPVIIELSARLTKKQCSFSSLSNSGEFGTPEQLDKILNNFESLGILKVVDSVTDEEYTHSISSNEKNGFYSKMKSFLGMR